MPDIMFPIDQNNFTRAASAWRAMSNIRRSRNRFKRYTYGDQHADIASRLLCHDQARDADQIVAHNLIRRIVKTVVGHFRSDPEVLKSYAKLPDDLFLRNQLDELDARALEEFLISGCAIQRVVAENRPCGSGIWVDNVAPDRFFVNAFRDSRSTDIRLVGMLHDFSPEEAIARFAFGSRERAVALHKLFASISDDPCALSDMGNAAFIRGSADSWRFIELWTLEADEQFLAHDRKKATLSTVVSPDAAWRLGFSWRCRWFAPDGSLIHSHGSLSPDGSHPFVVKFYPMTDGEIHPVVEDLIDQQRYINRIIVLIDKIMAASAKGVLLFPVEQKPKNVSWQSVAEAWSRTDGIIPINGRGGMAPQQVNTQNNPCPGAFDLLSLELKLFEESSGVSSALMGGAGDARTGSELYRSRVSNAILALNDIFRSFLSFTAARNRRLPH